MKYRTYHIWLGFLCLCFMLTGCLTGLRVTPRRVVSSTLPVDVLWRTTLGDGVIQSPLVADSMAFIVTSDLSSLDLATGEILWQRPVDINSIYLPLVLIDDILIFGEDGGNVTAVDAVTGEELWVRQYQKYTHSFISSLDAYDGQVFVVAQPTIIEALALHDGSLQWRLDTRQYPIGDRGVKVWTTGDKVYIMDDETYVVDPASGEVEEILDINLYLYQVDGDLLLGQQEIIDFDTLTPLLRLSPPDRQSFYTDCDQFDLPYERREGLLYAAGNCGGVYAIDAATGSTVWEYRPDQTAWPPLAIVDDNLYALFSDGEVHAISLESGENRGVLKTDGRLRGWTSGQLTSQGITTNGSILVITFNEPTVLGLGIEHHHSSD